MKLRLTTKDGSLIADKESDVSYYWKRGLLDKEWTEYMLNMYCREKGVQLVSYDTEVYKHELIAIHALVQWF